jgi:hypothetical protein
MWLHVNSFRVCLCVYVGGELSCRDYVMECAGGRVESRPVRRLGCGLLSTLYNKCKSTFQFSNLAKYGQGPPENGFEGYRNM